MKKILLITNGHGEDAVAHEIIKHLTRADDSIHTTTLSLVKEDLPSGGFSFRNPKYFWQDLRAGLLSNLIKNIGTLINNRNQYDLVIGVGDIIPLLFSRFIIISFRPIFSSYIVSKLYVCISTNFAFYSY